MICEFGYYVDEIFLQTSFIYGFGRNRGKIKSGIYVEFYSGVERMIKMVFERVYSNRLVDILYSKSIFFFSRTTTKFSRFTFVLLV